MESFNEFDNIDRDFVPPTIKKYSHPWDRWEDTNVPASEEIYKNRLKICGECPFYTDQQLCVKCGCFMPNKAKNFNAGCPVRKW